MEILYGQVRSLLQETQTHLQELTFFQSGNRSLLEAKVEENLRHLEQDGERLENHVRKELPQSRQQAKYRVDQLKSEIKSLQLAVNAYHQRKEQAELEARQRQELFSRQYIPSNSSTETTIAMDGALTQRTRLEEAHSGMDEILSIGRESLTGMRSQYSILKNARKKASEIFNTLSLSNTVMRLIERRTVQDKWIFWGGVIITLSIMFLVMWYCL